MEADREAEAAHKELVSLGYTPPIVRKRKAGFQVYLPH